MVDKQLIINRYRVDGYSQRRISRELHLNRKTVRKIIEEYEQSLSSPNPDESLEECLTSRPSYQIPIRPKRVLTAEAITLLEEFFAENIRKSALGMSKQRMLKSDMYEQLRKLNIHISYPTVCNYVSSLEQKHKAKQYPAFVHSEYLPGGQCEFDWGEVKLQIGTVLMKFHMAVFTLSHSNGRHCYLFRHQDTLAFMEAHRNYFRDVQGAPHQMVYDNMRVAIKQFIGTEKVPTESFLTLSNFYKFTYRFCNVRAGWEKGHVERSVDVVRRKAFAIRHEFATISDAQDHVSGVCERMNGESMSLATQDKQARYNADISALQPFSGNIGCFEMDQYKVDKWSTICMKKVHYSVPDHLVGKHVDVKIYSEKIVVYQDGDKIAEHQRIYLPGRWSIELGHYIGTLLRKPGAVASSTALAQLPQNVRKMYDDNFKDAPKDFVQLIQYAVENGFSNDELTQCYEILIGKGIKKPSLDQLKHSFHTLREPADPKEEKTDQGIEIEKSSFEILNSLTNIMDNK